MPDATTLSPLNAERSAPRQASKPRGRKTAPTWRRELTAFLQGETGLLRVVFRRILHRPMRSLVVLAGLGLTSLIVVNAIALQNEKHPAPFFAVAPVTAALPANAPLPPQRPGAIGAQPSEAELARMSALNKDLQGELARQGFFLGAIDGKPSSRFEIAIREYERAAGLPVTGQPSEKLLTQVSSTKLAMKDQLLLLIKDGAPASGADKVKTVEGVQRALNRLGYGPLKADGSFGASTKAAIEGFERDRKLAVKGEASGRLLKELSAASGIVIE